MIPLLEIERSFRRKYDFRLNGSSIVYRRADLVGGPFRSMSTDMLAKFIKDYLCQRDFGGRGMERSADWHAGIVEDFKAFITVGMPKFDRRVETFTDIPDTTVKHLIKGDQ